MPWMKYIILTVVLSFFVPAVIQRTWCALAQSCIALICSLLLFMFSFRTWYKWQMGKYRGTVKIPNKTVLITGGTAGIGFETARELARRQAKTVIITGRDSQKGEKAAATIRQETNNANVVFQQLELSSLENVRQFVQIYRSKYSQLDLLINNAGGSESEHIITSDGLEKVMASNYFGHFLLTHLLLPLLKASSSARIINLSSMVYKFGKLEADNLDWNRNFSGFNVYSASKLAMLLFTRSLATVLSREKLSITVNAVHPGIVRSELIRQIIQPFLFIANTIMSCIFKTSLEGAQTTLFCALEPDLDLVSGVYFMDCRANFDLYSVGKDNETATMLWETSLKLCGVDNKQE